MRRFKNKSQYTMCNGQTKGLRKNALCLFGLNTPCVTVKLIQETIGCHLSNGLNTPCVTVKPGLEEDAFRDAW